MSVVSANDQKLETAFQNSPTFLPFLSSMHKLFSDTDPTALNAVSRGMCIVAVIVLMLVGVTLTTTT